LSVNKNVKVRQSKCCQRKAKTDCQGNVCDCFFVHGIFSFRK
jgi:hypothetical protein